MSDQKAALKALALAWPDILRVVPNIAWTKAKNCAHTVRSFELLYALIIGLILEMRDAIDFAIEQGQASLDQAEGLRFEGRARESSLLLHIYTWNNNQETGKESSIYIKDLIEPVDRDAFIAFCWTAPNGMVEREELDITRLKRTTQNVRALRDKLDRSNFVELKKYRLIRDIIARVEEYVDPGTEHSSAETLSHQFVIAFARFMVTHDNDNKLTGTGMPPPSLR